MILLVEDDLQQRVGLKEKFPKGIKLEIVESVSLAKRSIKSLKEKQIEYDLILLDFYLGDHTAIDFMEWPFLQKIESTIVVMSAFASIPKVVETIRLGVVDFIEKPVTDSMIKHLVERYVRTDIVVNRKNKAPLSSIIFSPNSPLAFSIKLAEVVSHKVCPIFLNGESGTGKEVLSKYIHNNSHRNLAHFVALNCSSIPDNLIEAELFGYVKGAFTGANKDYLGKIRKADKGTLFLDEIGDMPLVVQTKLLRVLQDKKVTPLGSLEVYSVDFRLVSATNKDLEKLVIQGDFRQDLYYRICVFPIEIPPLRERVEDIPLLISFYLEKQGVTKVKTQDIIQNLPKSLLSYHWPGNIRELENIVERFIAMEDLHYTWEDILPKKKVNMEILLESKKPSNQDIIEALNQFNQHREKTAQFLGISRRTLQYRLVQIKK